MSIPGHNVASLLGVGEGLAQTRLMLMLEQGLPVSALERISKLLGPKQPDFKYAIVSKATLARRIKAKQRLTMEESDRVARLARVWEFALDVWKNEQDARVFLFKPHPMLDMKTPVEAALNTSIGAREVEAILGRLKYGTAI